MILPNHQKSPVVLIHGFWNTHKYLWYMAKALKKNGWTVFNDLDLIPNNGKVKLEILASQLDNYILNAIGEDEPFHMVAYSMGGLVGRYYFQNLANRKRVKSLITIGTPHYGTRRAYTFNRPGCHQMCPESDFLLKLNKGAALLRETSFTSVWANYDTIILPNQSAHVPAGKEVILPFGIHALLPFSDKIIQKVSEAMESAEE